MSGTIQPAPTGSMTIASGAATVAPTTYGYYPAEGSRLVSAQYSWLSQSAYAEDLSGLAARGVETTPQAAFIDNSANPSVVAVVIGGTGQVISVPANSQAVYPLFFSGMPSLQLSVPSPVAGLTRVYYSNVPVAPAMWGPNGTYVGTPPELSSGASSGPLLDAFGSLMVDTECSSPTYSAATFGASAAAATDVATLYGSASKIIRVHQIVVTSNQTVTVSVVRRSTPDAGGTSTSMTAVSHDSNSAAATAVATVYSANPGALGTAAGTIDQVQYTAGQMLTLSYGATDQSLVLRGTSQGIAVNFNGGGAGGGTCVKFRWTEI
jgi:hypothetical protein